MKKEFAGLNNATRNVLLALFILSIASIWIALWIVAMSVWNSPIPDFPLTMVEHMWKFFFVIPIPLASVVLGFIYIRQGYKCKKNIIAGIIMIFFLCVYGSFTSIFASQISHDWSYLYAVEKTVDFDFPDDGYIAVNFDYIEEGSSLIMVKVDEEHSGAFASQLRNNSNWELDVSFIPANAIDPFTLATTSEYDYFSVFNKSANSYNTFPGSIIFMAFDVETGTIFIYCQK